jgi:hypothetical protein
MAGAGTITRRAVCRKDASIVTLRSQLSPVGFQYHHQRFKRFKRPSRSSLPQKFRPHFLQRKYSERAQQPPDQYSPRGARSSPAVVSKPYRIGIQSVDLKLHVHAFLFGVFFS